MISELKYLSLFSGVGGFELGIQRAFDNQCKVHPEPADEGNSADHKRDDVQKPAPYCIGYSEIDKYAVQTYQKNWKGHTNYGDCTTIDETKLPDFQLLVGGFPCQAFSVAGKRAGFADTRGTLFFDIARILANKRPRHLVLENVKGLLSHDGGKTIQTISGVLTDLGYRIEWQVLNAKDFGVPQNRERIFIVGHLGRECAGQVFPIGTNHAEAIKQSIGKQTGFRVNRIDRSKQQYDLKLSETAGALTSTMWKGIDASGRTGVMESVRTLDANYNKGLLANQDRTGVYDGLRIRRLPLPNANA